MKRYVKSSSITPDYTIEIILNFEPKSNDIAAADKVTHPYSIKKKHRLSDDQLRAFNDLVESMIAPIRKRKFRINQEYQSKRSYAYYVDFNPVDREGNLFDETVRVLFRAAEHDIVHGLEDELSEGLILKSFTLLGKKYTNPFELQKKVIDICEHLMDGDFIYVTQLDT